jgi:hypothetical protein
MYEMHDTAYDTSIVASQGCYIGVDFRYPKVNVDALSTGEPFLFEIANTNIDGTFFFKMMAFLEATEHAKN